MSSPYTEFVNAMRSVEKDPETIRRLILKTVSECMTEKASDPDRIYFDKKYQGSTFLLFLEEFLQMMNQICAYHGDFARFFEDEGLMSQSLHFDGFKPEDLNRAFCGEKNILAMSPSEFICEMYCDETENYERHRVCVLGDHISFVSSTVQINFFTMLADYVAFYTYKFVRSNMFSSVLIIFLGLLEFGNREMGLLELGSSFLSVIQRRFYSRKKMILISEMCSFYQLN